jgi:beta-galactosidase
MMTKAPLLALAMLVSGMAGSTALADVMPSATHSVTFDDYSFRIDGKRVYLWSGEFHPYRLPSPDLWRDILQKMKAAGFNTTSIYFSWGYHSAAPGIYDFKGVRDMDRLLDIAAEEGIYVIARPGPYINAEVDSGGFPTWLSTKPVQNRSPDPAYLAYADEWLTHIDAIIARHQWTDGKGTVIAYQVENEFYRGDTADGRAYIQHLKDKALNDGITVPLIGNHNANFVEGQGALAVDGWDYYPQGFDCSNPRKWRPVIDMGQKRVPGQPLFTAEFQGGAFDPWGGPGYAKCAELINDKFVNIFYKQNIASGATAQNFYMLYGGTSWGWQAFPPNYTSYDYGAAITEARQFDAKYYEDKLIGYFTQAVAPLTKTIGTMAAKVDNDAVMDTARLNPESGTQFHYLRHKDSTAETVSNLHIDLMIGGRMYRGIPKASGTAITLNGRQSKMLLANYMLGDTTLLYSTSELMTHAAIDGREVAILYGDRDQPGETLLRLPRRPVVEVLAGDVEQQWADGELRLNYRHGALARVQISAEGAGRPLLLLIGDKAEAARFWRMDTSDGPVLVRGSHLLRTALSQAGDLALTGDVGADGDVEVFSGQSRLNWNGRPVVTRPTASGSLTGTLPTARAIALPSLNWRMREEAPDISPDFDDSHWQIADRTHSASITTPGTLPVLFADDYGFHTGNSWYRGHFRIGGWETIPSGVSLAAVSGGGAGAFSLWLNGLFLGSVQGKDLKRDFPFPPGSVKMDGDNILSILTVNMGHEEDYRDKNENRTARGLVSAKLLGAAVAPIQWRIQGKRGGEQLVDPVRGPMNNGGLYGERMGWSLPGYPDRDWKAVSLPIQQAKAGVTWYRSNVRLDLPKDQDTSVGIDIQDEPSRRYRAAIFVNGWQMGNYVNDIGPQHRFPIPNGILHPQGDNNIAIAVWNMDATSGGLGHVSLVNYGSYMSPLRVRAVEAPHYDQKRYRNGDAN